MSNEVVTYTLFLQSADKVSGTNNAAVFDVVWDQVLPPNYTAYKVDFMFQSTGGYYKDTAGASIYSTAQVAADFGARSYNWDSTRRGPSTTIGYVARDVQTTATSSNYFTCFNGFNPPITIRKPSGNTLTISLINTSTNTALVNTNSAGTAQSDMTAWNMVMTFRPIDESLIWDQRFQGL